MKDAEAVTFAGGTLDRASRLRGDAAAQAALAPIRGRGRCRSGAASRCSLFGDGTGLGWQPLGAALFRDAADEAIFLGLEDGAPRFARGIPDWPGLGAAEGAAPFLDASRTPHPDLPEPLAFGDLRAMMAASTPTRPGSPPPPRASSAGTPATASAPTAAGPRSSPTPAGAGTARPAARSISRAPTRWSSC